jgi:hypothetical protein
MRIILTVYKEKESTTEGSYGQDKIYIDCDESEYERALELINDFQKNK